MKQTSNLIVIQPLIVEEKQVVTQAPIKNEENCHTNKTKSISLKQKINNKRTERVEKELSRIIPSWIDKDFADYVSMFFNDSKDIVELYRIALVNSKKYDNINTPKMVEVALQSFKDLVWKIKNSKVTNQFGLYTAIVRKQLKSAHIKALATSVFDF